MDLIYAYEGDAADINTQSGRPFSILRQLDRHGCDVTRVFPLSLRERHLFLAKRAWYRARGLTYRPDREPLLLKNLARRIERRIRGVRADCILSPGSHAVAELDSPLPKLFVADATFANVIDFYDDFRNCAPEFLRLGHEQDRKALTNCSAAIYPSHWAARSAVEQYGADPGKVHVVPFGANVRSHDTDTVRQWIDRRDFSEMRVLFVGRDWKRKGADIVIEACNLLHGQGMPVRLDLVGISSAPVSLPAYAVNHGLLNKNRPDDRDRFEDLLSKAHFFFVPSRAENYGMAFCEAAAYGVPSISTAVGGIPTIVEDDATGFALPVDAGAPAYADILATCFADARRYIDLARSSRDRFEKRLNWNAFGDALVRIAGALPRRAA